MLLRTQSVPLFSLAAPFVPRCLPGGFSTCLSDGGSGQLWGWWCQCGVCSGLRVKDVTKIPCDVVSSVALGVHQWA